MKHLLLSTILAFSVSTAFAADEDKTKAMPKCTADHVPITLQTKDGYITACLKKDHMNKLSTSKGIAALGWHDGCCCGGCNMQ